MFIVNIVNKHHFEVTRKLHKMKKLMYRILFTTWALHGKAVIIISAKKTKVVAFKVKWRVHSKILVKGSNPFWQVWHFTFLGCDVNCEIENDVTNKVHKYQRVCDAMLFRSWDVCAAKHDIQRIRTAEMKGRSLRDQVRNEEVLIGLGTHSLDGGSNRLA